MFLFNFLDKDITNATGRQIRPFAFALLVKFELIFDTT